MRYKLSVWLTLVITASPFGALGDGWQAGVARVNITPEEPMWLSGYAARMQPAQGKLHDLWAKALVLQDAGGRRAVILTMDLVGIDRNLSLEVSRRIKDRYDIPREALALCASHTHSGPVVRGNLAPMYDLDARQRELVDKYRARLADKLVEVAGTALDGIQPVELSWGVDTATFAVNRRNNPEPDVPQRRRENTLMGPVDHDVPVLAVRAADGKLAAIVAGYACHATVLNGYLWSGDWPGAAQSELERRHPQATALYWAGCGGDQNPLPRRSVALLEEYGRQFADAVDRTLAGPMKPIDPALELAYEEIDLAFGEMPSRQQLEQDARGDDYRAKTAAMLLEQWDRDGSLKLTYPYPVQLWRLGSEVNWFFLGGEVVVDYSLRIKTELGPSGPPGQGPPRPVNSVAAATVWVAGYANDVMNYIPSRRVLQEGGYEGADARFVYGLPAPWSLEVERQIMSAVRELHARLP